MGADSEEGPRDCGCVRLSPGPVPFLSCCLLAPLTLALSHPYSSSGCWLFFLAPGPAVGLGATAPGADVNAAS